MIYIDILWYFLKFVDDKFICLFKLIMDMEMHAHLDAISSRISVFVWRLVFCDICVFMKRKFKKYNKQDSKTGNIQRS